MKAAGFVTWKGGGRKDPSNFQMQCSHQVIQPFREPGQLFYHLVFHQRAEFPYYKVLKSLKHQQGKQGYHLSRMDTLINPRIIAEDVL